MPLTSMMPLTAEAPTTHLWSSPLVPIMPGPERATLTSRNYPPLRETPREILRPRGFTKATQSTTRLQAHPPSRGMHTTEIPEALVSHFQSAAAAAVANTQWPVQATWARRKHRTFWEMMLEFLTSPALSHGVRSTTWLVAQLQSPAIHMSLKADAPVPRLWRPAAASIPHRPVQAALAWRRHRPFRKTSLGMLLVPEERNSESCAVYVAMFRADWTPYTGTPGNPRMT
ncbi:uncharacterized protein [Dermacentor albipictus]|uniref:uncharacterized protein isoform X14 n=1 Tax=Dermacentor albipictus TaxID=60249 RepID=UPI0038FCCF01